MTKYRNPPIPQGRGRQPLATEVVSPLQRAMTAHQSGRLSEAETLYRDFLRKSPHHPNALHFLGVLLAQRGDVIGASDLFRRASKAEPMNALFHSLLGKALLSLNRHAEALPAYEAAIKLNPTFVEALYGRGVALLGLKRLSEGIENFDTVLRLQPANLDALYNRATASLQLGKYAEALTGFDAILGKKRDHAEALNNRGTALRKLNRSAEALESYDRALQIRPRHIPILINRATVLQDMGRMNEALETDDLILSLAPDAPDALYNRADTLRELKRYDEAAVTLERLRNKDPKYSYALGHLMHAYLSTCEWSKESELASALINGIANDEPCLMPFLSLVHLESPEAQLRCARNYVSNKYPVAPEPLWQGERFTHAKIRVAYLSADFHNHATAYLMAELFEIHDRQKFEISAISFGPDGDGQMRSRLLDAFDVFDDVRTRSDLDVARLLREREIDIAIDLKGFTGGCRPGILSHRPAPIQVNFLGYPGTTGAGYIDYIIADNELIPASDERYYSEQVVRLPDSYQVNDRQRSVSSDLPKRSEVGLPESGFVFCCFNNNYKIRPAMFAIWMRLLTRVEGSVLWLLEDNPAARKHLTAAAVEHGIAPERLVFASRLPLDAHLARHALADLFLDTLPCNAHTTASDALWAGLPVLTCTGNTFASRVAASVIKSADLAELVTHTPDEYESLAYKLATSPQLLADVRNRLSHNRHTCPLFDTERYRTNLEAAYERMWRRYQEGLPPMGFSILAADQQ